jgi:hypothetical protein
MLICPLSRQKAYKGSRSVAPLVLTSVLDGSQRSISRRGRLIPGERTSVPIEYEAVGGGGEGSEVWRVLEKRKSLAISGVEHRTVQPIATINSVIVFR